MKYRINETDLNLDNIGKLIDKHSYTDKPRLEMLSAYYKSKNTVLSNRVETTTKQKNKIYDGFAYYITTFITSYFCSIPMKISTKTQENSVDELNRLLDFNDERNHELLMERDRSIYGIAFEVCYLNKNNLNPNKIDLKFKRVNPSDCFIIYSDDLNEEPLCGVRYYKSDLLYKEDNTTYVELYYADRVDYCTTTGGTPVVYKSIPHYFKTIPLISRENNYERMGDFERVISGIDAYNKLMSGTADDIEYLADAYLYLKGVSLQLTQETYVVDPDTGEESLQTLDITPEQALSGIKDNRVILDENATPDSDVRFVTKDINHTAIDSLRQALIDDIHKFSFVIDINDKEFAGNISGEAMKYKLLMLENITKLKEALFIKSFNDRINIINRYFELQAIKPIDISEINYIFTRNLPKNLTEISDMVVKLEGIISQETSLELLPFIDNAKEEMERIASEKEANIQDSQFPVTNDVNNMNNMQNDMTENNNTDNQEQLDNNK
jgi:SPP1 family phage portal protein